VTSAWVPQKQVDSRASGVGSVMRNGTASECAYDGARIYGALRVDRVYGIASACVLFVPMLDSSCGAGDVRGAAQRPVNRAAA
jgi:hypothetical protein